MTQPDIDGSKTTIPANKAWRGLYMLFLIGGYYFSSNAAKADVYKWVDAKGGIHFSDRPPPDNDQAASQNVASVNLPGSGPSFSIRRLTPLSEGDSAILPLRLTTMVLKVIESEKNDYITGRHFSGETCSEALPFVIASSELDFNSEPYKMTVREAFQTAGWALESGAAVQSRPALVLSGEVQTLQVERCSPPESSIRAGARAYIKIRWQLLNPDDEVLYRGSSEGSVDGWGAQIEYPQAIKQALAMAANNILADKKFADKIRDQRYAALLASGSNPLIKISWGDRSGSVAQRSQTIQQALVSVQTADTVGNGVVIDAAGWALTSASLVSKHSNVVLITGRKSIPAAVIKSDSINDVALLRFVRNDFSPALIAPYPVLPGDSIYLGNRSANVNNAGPMDKAIITAHNVTTHKDRLLGSAPEPSVLPGTPVFNRYGELTGLVVKATTQASVPIANIEISPILSILQALSLMTP